MTGTWASKHRKSQKTRSVLTRLHVDTLQIQYFCRNPMGFLQVVHFLQYSVSISYRYVIDIFLPIGKQVEKMNPAPFESLFSKKISETVSSDDPAHDFLHFKRVVRTAKNLCEIEKANIKIVLPAAWLHDFVVIPKNDPRRKQASQLSARAAVQYLREINYPEEFLEDIAHAIEAHSFSANIKANTLEAQIVQDADRLDGLGAIGIARCFATAGLLKVPFYSEIDPFCHERSPDDRHYTIDHFFAKLFKVAESLHTSAGKNEGFKRVEIMKRFLNDLNLEIDGS